MRRISCPWQGIRIRWSSRTLQTQSFCGLWCGHVWKYKLALKLSWGIKPHSVCRERSAHIPGWMSCSAWAPVKAVPGQAADLALGTAGKNRLFPHPVFCAYLHLIGFNELPPKPSKIMLSLFKGRWPSNIPGGYYINSRVPFYFFLLLPHFLFFILKVKNPAQKKTTAD